MIPNWVRSRDTELPIEDWPFARFGRLEGTAGSITSDALDRLAGSIAINSIVGALDWLAGSIRINPTVVALDWFAGFIATNSTAEALDRLTVTTATDSTSEALDGHHDIAPEALDRLRSRDSLRAAPFGRRACFVVRPVPGLALRVHQDSTATAPRSSPADSFGARGAPASLVPRTVPAGGRLGGPRRPPASARHVSTGYYSEPPANQYPGGLKGRGAVAPCVARPKGAPRCR